MSKALEDSESDTGSEESEQHVEMENHLGKEEGEKVKAEEEKVEKEESAKEEEKLEKEESVEEVEEKEEEEEGEGEKTEKKEQREEKPKDDDEKDKESGIERSQNEDASANIEVKPSETVEEQNTENTTENTFTNPSSEWQPIWDETIQAYYYWNILTNETTWQPPLIEYANPAATNDTDTTTKEKSEDASEINNNAYQEYYNNYYNHYGYYPEGYYTYDPSIPAAAATTASPQPSTNPLDTLLDKIDTEVKSKLDGSFTSTATTTSAQDPYYTSPASTTDNESDYNAFMAQHGGGDYTVQARFNTRTGRFQRDPALNPERFSADSKALRQMSYFFDYERFSQERGEKRLKTGEGGSEKSLKLTKRELGILKQRKKEKKEMKKKAWLMGDD